MDSQQQHPSRRIGRFNHLRYRYRITVFPAVLFFRGSLVIALLLVRVGMFVALVQRTTVLQISRGARAETRRVPENFSDPELTSAGRPRVIHPYVNRAVTGT
jgi:hypothetical protein